MNKKNYDSDGMRTTDCCGAFSTYVDGGETGHCNELCCKQCYREVGFGEGDGNEYRNNEVSKV